MTIAVLAEKPSVARDLARVLGATARGEGFLHGGGYVVTWAIGHLVALAEPDEIDPRWARWRLADLPMIPSKWPLAVLDATRDQFAIVRRILSDEGTTEIVAATDAGREGELIFRYIYDAVGVRKKVSRLWLSSLTDDAIAKAFRKLRPIEELEPLANAARARSRADWLVGLNFSRLYSVTHDTMYSVGRVQTPTLAMLVGRELEIRGFVPEDYFEIGADFATVEPRASGPSSYRGWLLSGQQGKPREVARFAGDGEAAKEIASRAARGEARVESIDRETHSVGAPRLYDLTELQRHANRLFGLSAQRTLDTAQALYEKHKLISYPRTDSRHLSTAVADTLPAVIAAIAPAYDGLLAKGTGERSLGARFVDDSMVTDHHAIIPTVTSRGGKHLSDEESKIYDLLCRRLLSAWHDDHVYASTHVVTAIQCKSDEEPIVHRFLTSGSSVERIGWKVLDLKSRAGARSDDAEETIPGGLRVAEEVTVERVSPAAKKTRPPQRFTDATLLTAMESAGRALDEAELTNAIRDFGLGTPATRASIVETLIRRQYVARDGKALVATESGIALVAAVHPKIKSPILTGEWERTLRSIERGRADFDRFMSEIEAFVAEVVRDLRERAPAPTATRSFAPDATAPFVATEGTPAGPPPPLPARKSRVELGEPLGSILHSHFGFGAFRPYQEEVCRAAVEGRDVLLVMPTGAGKSLCYQLPGLARGGTTLVVSPLIALMEDQVAKLKAAGLSAERIHSGRDRQASRAVCRAYLDGELDYLFVAPERLKVPGFVPMLARRTPSLIAVDEAHCISQWGHDFRPDYRILGEWIEALRPSPVIALTATATPTVQDDIVAQLGLREAARFIHGFRRNNLAIEVIEQNPGERTDTARQILSDEAQRPAILYAPTRKHAEQLASELAKTFPVAAYHAGMTGEARERVQLGFQAGSIDAVVATVAFGMGIDKADVRTVIHTALPATVEGYYQEIGRAGRDGLPSRVILLQSFVDRKTHEFFFERDYPTSDTLQSLFAALSTKPLSKSSLADKVGLDESVFDKALEKLWVHGGAVITPEETIVRGKPEWKKSYEAQRRHREEQSDKIHRFATTEQCRMLQLVRHFGDENDEGTACGVCDVCSPATCVARRFREPSARELAAVETIVEALRERNGLALGQIHREHFDKSGLDRSSFQHIVFAMVRAKRLRLEDATFERGETISFQRAWLTMNAGTSIEMSNDDPDEKRGASRTRKKRAERAPRDAKHGASIRTSRRGDDTSVRGPASAARSGSIRDLAAGGPLAEELRAWRLMEARKKGVPAFRIMSDRTLFEIAECCPHTEAALLSVHGVGPTLASKFGTDVLAIVRRFAGHSSTSR